VPGDYPTEYHLMIDYVLSFTQIRCYTERGLASTVVFRVEYAFPLTAPTEAPHLVQRLLNLKAFS
jgi:hypothetical protein